MTQRPTLPTEVAQATRALQALRRVVGNLLDNAVKFGEGHPVVLTVTRAQPPTQVHITVEDAGPGIPEAELAAVLQPFHRLEASRNRDSGGTGLGLAIAQQLSLALSNRPEGGLQARLSLSLGGP